MLKRDVVVDTCQTDDCNFLGDQNKLDSISLFLIQA